MSFTIGKNGSFIEHVKLDAYDISLLARGDGTEIMIQTIAKDNYFYIYPSENPDVMEFFYILQGELECEHEGEKIKFGPNDYYYAKNITENIHFKTLSDVVYLWVITEPTFYQLSESISEFTSIVEKVEQKDRYTMDHSERVATYAMKIAKKMRLSKERLENLYIASFLHDIGKINTPEEILNKPGKLTDEEYDIIKRHPSDGAEMVKGSYYDGIVTIIEQHHERLNGTGYPNRLQGEQIVLEARIIAVSDTFDAMTEDRAYRKGFTVQYCLDELKRLVNTHYDENVVRAFEEVLREEGRI
ncbi:HD-GYP domain-containing protein [Bacillus pinisoli]|uniref:HD-GYP domain-containing protein n=1 Tax=Bacillus pinisoli TaxID=2901866 RepID=UPI001FF43A65|nr:HD-GYP domain-containing protein [Bacillus pinisoli]